LLEPIHGSVYTTQLINAEGYTMSIDNEVEDYALALRLAVEFSIGMVARGASWYTATEVAQEEFNVSLSDIQAQVPMP
jgi:hypothetical protein